jgi:hypothetical protein
MRVLLMLTIVCLLCIACGANTPDYYGSMFSEYYVYSLAGGAPYDISGTGASQAELEDVAKQVLASRKLNFHPGPGVAVFPKLLDSSTIAAERAYSIVYETEPAPSNFLVDKVETEIGGVVTYADGNMLLDLYENYTSTPPVAHMKYTINLEGAQSLIDEIKGWRIDGTQTYTYSNQELEVEVELRSTDESFPWVIHCKQRVRAMAERKIAL